MSSDLERNNEQLQVTFNIGDKIVYPQHGVGEITKEEIQSIVGQEISVYVIDFADKKLTLHVPKRKVKGSGMRQLHTLSLLEKAIDSLKISNQNVKNKLVWNRKMQEYRSRIDSGDPFAIASVIKELYKNIGDQGCSYSERNIYDTAMDRLAMEYALVKKVSVQEIKQKILDILKSTSNIAA